MLTCKGMMGFNSALNYEGTYYLSPQQDPLKAIPFSVTGTLSQPKPSLSTEGLLRQTVRGVFEKILKPQQPKTDPEKEKKKEEKSIIEEILDRPIF